MSASRALTLRPAHAGDATAMAAISRDLVEAGLPWHYTPRRMAALIADADIAAVVACEGARVLGLAVMSFGDERAHLVLLAVRGARQRRGIGRALLEWQLATARVAGIAAVDLELREDNEGARAFYERLGFAETGFVAGYYEGRIGARRMTLRLAA